MDDVHQPTACPDPARAALYGKFLEVAYWMYDSAPNNPTPSPPSDFPADYEVFAWVQMRDFVIAEGNWTFYGIIAQSRTNLNEYVLAIRGTGRWQVLATSHMAFSVFMKPCESSIIRAMDCELPVTKFRKSFSNQAAKCQS